MIPLSVSAETSGGIQASSSTLSILPASPEAGDSITIYLTLYNSQQTDAFDVEYAFYKDGVSSNKLLEITFSLISSSIATFDLNLT